MKVRKVNRYYCDFCKKSGCSAYHIRKHEERCTLNPNRFCGVCAMIGEKQIDIQKIISSLPNIEDFKLTEPRIPDVYNDCIHDLVAYQKRVHEIIDTETDCPACKLAVLRQGKIDPFCSEWDFKKEMQGFMDQYNEDNRQKDFEDLRYF